MRFLSLALLWACALPVHAAIVGEELAYSVDGQSFSGYMAYDDEATAPRPGVLVVHEWWGHNSYARQRANMLAGQGYVALALDMYGAGKLAAHPADAKAFMQAAMQEPGAIARRFAAARSLLESRADPEKIAAIGYCFGGAVVLNMARAGADLAGVVSFHGSLGTQRAAQPGQITAPILVFNGEADPFVPAEQVAAFQAEMAEAKATMRYVGYPGVLHSFTSPGATAKGQAFDMPLRYDEAADKDSWAQTLRFLSRVLGSDSTP